MFYKTHKKSSKRAERANERFSPMDRHNFTKASRNAAYNFPLWTVLYCMLRQPNTLPFRICASIERDSGTKRATPGRQHIMHFFTFLNCSTVTADDVAKMDCGVLTSKPVVAN